MLVYRLNNSSQKIIFEDQVLEQFQRFKQLLPNSFEAGGQLFAEFIDDEVIIKFATSPYKKDNRSRFGFLPFRKKSQKDINVMFKQGLHYIGDWHTHPQKEPMPSSQDNFSMRDKYIKSKHELKKFVMVIVGTKSFPDGLWVSIHNESKSIKLELSEVSPEYPQRF